MKLANRIQEIEESKSVGLAAIVARLRSEGREIISLNVGEPDFPTPDSIITATKKALDENKTRYSLVQGIMELREGIAKKVSRDSNYPVSYENIILGNGSKHILYNIFQTIINPEDEVIIPSPYWVTFPESVKLAGGVPVFVPTTDLQLNIEAIEKAITKKTKAIIINTPNNPTGAVYPKEDLQKVADLAVKHDFYIIADEAYELLTFDDIPHVAMGSLNEEVFNRTLTVQSFSKSYCMTGFRIGYLVGPAKIVEGMNKLQSHLSGNNCTFAQYGALEALQMDQNSLKEMIRELQKRRDLAYKLCKEIFPNTIKPEGAFYLYPNVQDLLGDKFKTDEDLAKHILMEAGVAILPGSYFGTDGYLRFSFAGSEENIKKAFKQIKDVL
ncbi:MAG: pyridoxal phosphate-dependent aminotransferase [Bacteriovoracaceae bacterium]|nr:pyridoxal phosphate-dependent aminotransferase [Bacteriovoracaceae bacterium]